MRIKFNSSPCLLNIFVIYAPTTAAEDELIEQLYQKLEDSLKKIPDREICIILGDFNAKVGSTKNDNHIGSIVGKFGLGERNERGERLIQFCIDNKFTITNTAHKQHKRRLYTWRSPDGLHKNQIDYILIRSRWRTSIHNAKTLPSADCGSDHQLLISENRIKLKRCKINKTTRTLVRNVPEGELWNVALSKNLQPLKTHDMGSMTAEEAWGNIKSAIIKTAEEVVTSDSIRKRQPWISDSTLNLCMERRNIKSKGLDNPVNYKQYRAICNAIQRGCRKDKLKYYENLCCELESHMNNNQPKDLFQKIKELTRKFKPKSYTIVDTQGSIQTDLDQVLEVWRRYCEDLYNDETTEGIERDNSSDQEPDILISEVENAVSKLKKCKSVGTDSIPAEILKKLNAEGLTLLHQLCQTIWKSGKWPKEWSTSIFIPLHKKGSTKDCLNYRTIALISHASKIMLYIIRSRLLHYTECQIAQEQAGFVKNRGTREQILNVRILMEKAREHYMPMYLCFVDFEKAFDNVRWSRLWTVLLEMGIPEHLVTLIQGLYENSDAVVRIDNVNSNTCKISKGVRQGCVLSPLLYNLYSEHLMRNVLEGWENGVKIGGTKISNLRFADDTLLIASSEAELENFLDRLKVHSEEYGLKINNNKSKVMIVDRENEGRMQPPTIANCEVVKNFIYLGSLLQNTGSCEMEIRRRIQLGRTAMSNLTKLWKDRNISLKTKIRLVNALVFSVFLYASETWVMRMADRRRVDAFEMWVWRRMLRIPWTARRTNASILEQVKPSHRLSNIVTSRILKFFGHITRQDNIERIIVQGMPDGKRRRGRSPMRWIDAMKLTGTNLKVATRNAQNRDKWRRTVAQVIGRLDRDGS